MSEFKVGDYGTSGETNLTDEAAEKPNLRTEALFAAIQSFGPASNAAIATSGIIARAETFLDFLEGKND